MNLWRHMRRSGACRKVRSETGRGVLHRISIARSSHRAHRSESMKKHPADQRTFSPEPGIVLPSGHGAIHAATGGHVSWLRVHRSKPRRGITEQHSQSGVNKSNNSLHINSLLQGSPNQALKRSWTFTNAACEATCVPNPAYGRTGQPAYLRVRLGRGSIGSCLY